MYKILTASEEVRKYFGKKPEILDKYYDNLLHKIMSGSELTEETKKSITFISGTGSTDHVVRTINPKTHEKMRRRLDGLALHLKKKTDKDLYVLVNLGAGFDVQSVIKYFNWCDDKIIVSRDEPGNYDRAYKFMKIALFDTIRDKFKKKDERNIIDRYLAKATMIGGVAPIYDDKTDEEFELEYAEQFIAAAIALDKKFPDRAEKYGSYSSRFYDTLRTFNPKIVINQVHDLSRAEERARNTIINAAETYLMIRPELFTMIAFDPKRAERCLNTFTPYVFQYADFPISQIFHKISNYYAHLPIDAFGKLEKPSEQHELPENAGAVSKAFSFATRFVNKVVTGATNAYAEITEKSRLRDPTTYSNSTFYPKEPMSRTDTQLPGLSEPAPSLLKGVLEAARNIKDKEEAPLPGTTERALA